MLHIYARAYAGLPLWDVFYEQLMRHALHEGDHGRGGKHAQRPAAQVRRQVTLLHREGPLSHHPRLDDLGDFHVGSLLEE
jgi:hypothetical protein